MRLFITFCLTLGMSSGLFAEQKPVSKEADLARKYYSAIQKQDFDVAEKIVFDLKKRSPQDLLTKFVSEHWEETQNSPDATNWKEHSKERKSEKEQIDSQLVTTVYQIADLVVPTVLQGTREEHAKRSATALIELLHRALRSKSTFEENSELIYVPQNLSLVARLTQQQQFEITKILRQIRKTQDLQVSYEIRVLAVPAEIGDGFPLREIVTNQQRDLRFQKLTTNDDVSVLLSPSLTSLSDQTVSFEADFTHCEIHGRVSEDRRSIAIEARLSRDGEEVRPSWIFETSDVIPDGKTGFYFIKTQDAPSKLLDHRLLRERGVELGPTDASQYFLMITPKIVVPLEEEELISLNKNELGQTLQVAYPLPDPHYFSNMKPGWTPAKLEWDDGNWNLDFEASEASEWKWNGQQLPTYWPSYPVQKTAPASD